MPITEFWEITPYELNVAAMGYAKRRRESWYQVYMLSRWVWTKRVNIQKFLGDKPQKQTMTDEQMLAKVQALNAAFGGKVVRR